jgi:hypothetical protein
VAESVARQLTTVALWVRIQTSLKNHKWATKAKEWPTHSSPPKKYTKKKKKIYASPLWTILSEYNSRKLGLFGWWVGVGGGYHKRMGLYAPSVPLAGTFMYKCTVPYHSSSFLKGEFGHMRVTAKEVDPNHPLSSMFSNFVIKPRPFKGCHL